MLRTAVNKNDVTYAIDCGLLDRVFLGSREHFGRVGVALRASPDHGIPLIVRMTNQNTQGMTGHMLTASARTHSGPYHPEILTPNNPAAPLSARPSRKRALETSSTSSLTTTRSDFDQHVDHTHRHVKSSSSHDSGYRSSNGSLMGFPNAAVQVPNYNPAGPAANQTNVINGRAMD